MQDFALNLSKFSWEDMPQKPLENLVSFAGLYGKVEIWTGK
jgi:hypothetical protein